MVKQGVVDSKRAVTADVTFSSSYATGGDTLSPASLGLKAVTSAFTMSGSFGRTASSGFTPAGNGLQVVMIGSQTAPTLQVFNGSVSEVSATTDLSAKPAVRIEFRGN